MLNIFGEIFFFSAGLELEYVVVVIDVKEQNLKIFQEKKQVGRFDYKLR